tara:strand:- start:796 stop:921 length:126 start_codon:yes stop_codon:yes gene_type:complete
MFATTEVAIESLGNEPKEILGFETEEELELALKSLMEEISD